ncbi:MAG: hypothetical protein JSV24_05400 [Bacteroidales bacterium]|nr:MAG: hypothetical protein JSV24_05400 [Bacteroidales bacterium]
MKRRSLRHNAIREIITNLAISSQDQLIHKLKEKGFDCTQATISRDLKFLRVYRVADEFGNYVYRLTGEVKKRRQGRLDIRHLTDNIKALEFSDKLALLKTNPGYANSVAIIIDQVEPFEILGTVAGDDTILIVAREGVPRSDVRESVFRIFPGMKNRIR